MNEEPKYKLFSELAEGPIVTMLIHKGKLYIATEKSIYLTTDGGKKLEEAQFRI